MFEVWVLSFCVVGWWSVTNINLRDSSCCLCVRTAREKLFPSIWRHALAVRKVLVYLYRGFPLIVLLSINSVYVISLFIHSTVCGWYVVTCYSTAIPFPCVSPVLSESIITVFAQLRSAAAQLSTVAQLSLVQFWKVLVPNFNCTYMTVHSVSWRETWPLRT